MVFKLFSEQPSPAMGTLTKPHTQSSCNSITETDQYNLFQRSMQGAPFLSVMYISQIYVYVYVCTFIEEKIEAQRGGGMTCSRSPARYSKGQDHSPNLLTPWAAWRSPYMEFLRIKLHFLGTPGLSCPLFQPSQKALMSRGQRSPFSHHDHQEAWVGVSGGGAVWSAASPRGAQHTYLCVFSPKKSHPSINNCECVPGMQLTCAKCGYTRVFHINLKR